MMDAGMVERRTFSLGDGQDVVYELGWASKMPPEEHPEHVVFRSDGVAVNEMRGMFGTRYAMTMEYTGMASDVISAPLTPHQAKQAEAVRQDMLLRFGIRSGVDYETIRALDAAADHCQGSPEFPGCRIPNGMYRSDDAESLVTWNPRVARHWESEEGHSVMQCSLTVGHVEGVPKALCQRCLASSKGQLYPVRRRKAA